MSVDLTERARRYVATMDAAVSGSDGHGTTFAVACVLVKGFNLSTETARRILDEYNGRCDPPWSARELDHKISEADRVPDDKPRGWLAAGATPDDRKGDGVASEPKERKGPKLPEYQPELLEQFAQGCRQRIDREWLAVRSPMAVEWGSRPGLATDFLTLLYEPDEAVLIFTEFTSPGDFAYRNGKTYRLAHRRGVAATPSALPVSSPEGVWYLVNPVHGRWSPKPGKWGEDRSEWGRRHGDCVTAWRYAVLESDKAPPELWLRALVQLDLRIAAIYTSGGKSIHALVRLDASSKLDFDGARDVLISVLCKIGMDGRALSGVRLSRLPGCVRGRKGVQELWYLDPKPKGGLLLQRQPIRALKAGKDPDAGER